MCVFQIEDIRNSIDKIDENVAEVKKLYSLILSAPTSDQSEISNFLSILNYLDITDVFLLNNASLSPAIFRCGF